MPRNLTCAVTLLALLTAFPAAGQTRVFRVISWNLQSGNSDPDTLAEQAATAGDAAIWGFSEVANAGVAELIADELERVTQLDYAVGVSVHGGGDRLAILYRTDLFEPVDDEALEGFFEIPEIALGTSLRPGFGVQLEERSTGLRFFFVVNHFKAFGGQSNIEKRIKQATALNAFANAAGGPVVAVGDYNTFFRIDAMEIPPALHEMTEAGPFEWIRPEPLVPTEDTGRTILDYVLVANGVEGWTAESRVLRRDDLRRAASPDDPFTDSPEDTDHRPVEAVFTLETDSRVERLRAEIVELEAELAAKRLELGRLRKGGGGPSTDPTVFIHSMVPNPDGPDDSAESVNLMNTGDTAVSLSGWRLKDDDGGHWLLSGAIDPGGRVEFVRPGEGMRLGNGGDVVILVNREGVEVDQLAYASAGSGQVVTRP